MAPNPACVVATSASVAAEIEAIHSIKTQLICGSSYNVKRNYSQFVF